MTRQHIHEETFEIAQERMFEHLITPSAVRKWWGAARVIVLAEKGGIWAAAWGEDEDSPEYVSAFDIVEFDPPARIFLANARYSAVGRKLPFDLEMTTEFIVSPSDSGCLLRVVQAGFPSDAVADEFYAACEKGWKDTFRMMRSFVEEEA